jgi:hypothetical protein
MIAYQPNTKILWMALQAHGAIDGTYLMYNTNCEYPIGAMKRALKYTKRGFTLCQETFLSIVLSIGKLDLKDTNVLNQQLSFYGVIRLDDPTIRDLFSDHFILDLIEYKRPNGNQIKRQIAIKNKYKDIGKDLILSLETGRTPNIVYTRFKDQPTEEENIDLYNLDIPFPEFVENLIDKRYESIIE